MIGRENSTFQELMSAYSMMYRTSSHSDVPSEPFSTSSLAVF